MTGDPDVTMSADGSEPFDDPFAEMRYLLNSLDADRSEVEQMDVALHFGESEVTAQAQLPDTSGDGGQSDEEADTTHAAVRTDPSMGIEVDELGDGWLRAADGDKQVRPRTKRAAALVVLVECNAASDPIPSNEFGEIAVEAGVADEEEKARAPLSALYKKGLADRRRADADGNGLHFTYRPNPAAEAVVKEWKRSGLLRPDDGEE